MTSRLKPQTHPTCLVNTVAYVTHMSDPRDRLVITTTQHTKRITMTSERRSATTTQDHRGERLPWVLPEYGVHVTTFVPADMMTALGVSAEVAATLTNEHPQAVTTYDSDTVMAGCGCGWVSHINQPLDSAGREATARDLAGHLREAVGRVEFRGTSVA